LWEKVPSRHAKADDLSPPREPLIYLAAASRQRSTFSHKGPVALLAFGGCDRWEEEFMLRQLAGFVPERYWLM